MTKKKMNSYIKLSLAIFISAIIGAIVGVSAAAYGFSFKIPNFYNLLPHLLQGYGYIITLYALVVILLPQFILGRMKNLAKSLPQAQEEKADFIEEKINRLSVIFGVLAAVFTSLSVFFLAIHMHALIHYDISEAFTGAALLFYRLNYLLLIIGVICNSYRQIHMVKLLMKMYPHRYADPLSINFQEKWVNSCDEAEQAKAYRAAFYAYSKTQKLLLVFICLFLLLTIFWAGGFLPLLLSCLLLAYLTVSYQVQFLKSKNK